MSNAQDRSPNQEQRQVRSKISSYLQPLRRGQFSFQCPFESEQRRNCIPRCAAESPLYRQPLLNLNHDPAACLERKHCTINNSIAGIRIVFRHAGIFTTNLNARATPNLYANYVVQRDRLINRSQLMKAIMPRRTNAQTEVDLG